MTISAQRTSMRVKSRLQQAASGIVVASSAFFPGSAHAETRAWVNTSLTADIGTNPYLQTGSNTSSASGVLSVAPGVKFLGPNKTIILSGNYRHREFSTRYPSSDSYSASASIVQKLSAKFGLDANIGYNNAVVGANNLLTFNPNPTNGGPSPPLPGGISLNGLRERRDAINGSLGLNYAPDSRNSLQTQGGFSLVRFPKGSTASEYSDVNGRIGYSRTLNSRMSVGLNISYSRANYLRTSLGDATTISPQATFSTKFGSSWSLALSLGVSHSRINSLTGKTAQDSAAGTFTLCDAAVKGKLCLHASRSVQPTSFGSTVRPQTSVGVTFNTRLDSKSTIDLNANLSRSGQSGLGNIGFGGTVDYGQANLTYSRRISQRFQGYVTASYADSFRDPIPRKANAMLSVGISYTFGDLG